MRSARGLRRLVTTKKINRFVADSANDMRIGCEAAYGNGKEDDLDAALCTHSECPAPWLGPIACHDYDCALMLPVRRGRPTLRCLTSDLGMPVPGLDVDLSDLDYPILNELRRVAPTSPKGQKRILSIDSIDNPLVYRIRVSSHRGATWIDEAAQVVWLCAARRREEGSDGDAYAWFAQLHGRGHLLPTADDALRDRAEAAIRRQRELRRDLLALLDKGLTAPDEEQCRDLGGWAPCRALVIRGEGAEEIWCALSTRAVDDTFIQPQVRDLLFAALEAHVGSALFEVRTDWPTGPLDWAEIVKLGVRYD